MEPAIPDNSRPDIRLVALDIDGTLLSSDKTLPSTTQRVIARCLQRGVKVVLASARPPRAMRAVYRLLKLDTYSVHYNGALIGCLKTNRYWSHLAIEPTFALRAVQVARQLSPTCLINVEILDKWYTDRYDATKAGEMGRMNPPTDVGPLESFLVGPITKLMILDEPAKMVPVRQELTSMMNGQAMMPVTDECMVQLMHPEVDKAPALARIARKYRIAQEQVMAIGDAPNDSGMLQWAGLGVAVANAWVQVLDAADVVVPPNDVGAVASAIQHYVLDAPHPPAV